MPSGGHICPPRFHPAAAYVRLATGTAFDFGSDAILCYRDGPVAGLEAVRQRMFMSFVDRNQVLTDNQG